MVDNEDHECVITPRKTASQRWVGIRYPQDMRS